MGLIGTSEIFDVDPGKDAYPGILAEVSIPLPF